MTELVDIRKVYKEKLVYIDFESVSVPLAYNVGLGGEYPYAYSVAIYGENGIKTFIFEGKNFRGNIAKMKWCLMRDIGMKHESELSKYVFVGWNGGLEKQVLKHMFGTDFKYTDLMLSNREFSAALDDIAVKSNKLELGFEYTRSLVNEHIEAIFLNRKKGKKGDFEPLTNYKDLRSGAIACLIGAIKYGSMTTRGKSTIEKKMKLKNFNIDKMTAELRKYSKKDVEDMIYISDNFDLSVRRYNFMKENHIKRIKYKEKFFNVNGILKKLERVWDEKMSTTDIFENYFDLTTASYMNRAYKELNCDELDFDKADEVEKLAKKYKKYEEEDVSTLKELIVSEKLWTDDFFKVLSSYSENLERFRKYKEEQKLKAKSEVINVK